MPNDSPRPDVAVFIDFENVYVSVRDKLDANPNFEMIMDRVEDFGRVVIARAYADWYRYPRVTSALYANNIEPMYVPTYYYDRDLGRTGRAIKNSVDMNLCIDAMKTLFTNTNIAKFVLATGDRDFIPLVNTIRQHGKEVIVIGIGGAASAHLAQSADEFIFYEQLIGKKPTELDQDQPRAKMPEKGRDHEGAEAEEQPQLRSRDREAAREAPREAPRTEAPRAETPRVEVPREAPRAETPAELDIYDTLVNAINLARERGYVCSFGSLKLLMKELMGGDFKEAKYKDGSGRPFAKFKDFVLEAERRGKVQVFTSGTVNEVFLPGEDPYKLSQFAGDIKEDVGAPILQVSEAEARVEARPSSTTNGRRRRRRSRGPQRPDGPPQDGTMQLDELGEIDDDDDVEYTAPDELSLPELFDPLSGSADRNGQEQSDARSEAIFEELRELVEAEADETESIANLAPPEFLAELTAPEASEVAGETAPAMYEPAVVVAAEPFTDLEWALVIDVVGQLERPASFQQIHDLLRDARNNAGITRTNEELRSLIKQSINNGTLERIGKGNRASYRLAPPAEEVAPDQTEQIVQAQSEPRADTQPGMSSAEGTAQIAQLDTEMLAEASVEPEIAHPAAKRSRSRRKPAAEAAPAIEAAPAPVAEAAPAKPARSSRKKPAPVAEVEA
ncbi:MAG: NYN domain-containing protein, partial [Roseiflexaceae bacterium]